MPFDDSIQSLTVIGEELAVIMSLRSKKVYILNRDSSRELQSKVPIVKVITGYSGKLIVASPHSIHLINNIGSVIENIYTNTRLSFRDLSLWKGDLYVLSARKVSIFVNKTDKWEFSENRSNMFKHMSNLIKNTSPRSNDYGFLLAIFIREHRVYLYKQSKQLKVHVYVYNLRGEFLDERKVYNGHRLCGVDSEGTLLLQTTYSKPVLYLCTTDGKAQIISIPIPGQYYIGGVLINPESNTLYMWVWELTRHLVILPGK